MFIPTARLAVAIAVLALPATASAAAGESSITNGPPQFTNATQAQFSFASTDADDVFECKLDDAPAFTDCPSPYTTPALGEGAHTLEVRAADPPGAGRGFESTPSTHSWTVDVTPPNTSLTGKPAALGNDKTATFVFASNDPSASFVCSLNGANPAPCTSPVAYSNLTDGERTFTVRAVDKAGNQDSSPESHTWTVDTAAPETQITAGPTGPTNDKNAAVTFSAADAIAYECRVDGGPWNPCTSPHTPSGLADGNHVLEVRAADAAGNLDATPAARSWTLDTTAPAVMLHIGPVPAGARPAKGVIAKPAQVNAGPLQLATASFQTTRNVVVTWGGAGQGATYGVAYLQTDFPKAFIDGGAGLPWKSLVPAGTPAGSKPMTLAAGKRYCFAATATDAAGNVSQQQLRCTTIPAKASSLTKTGAWTKTLDSGAFLGQYMKGTNAGQLIRPTIVYGGRQWKVALVATTCPTCGKVQVKAPWLDKTIDLTSATTKQRKLFIVTPTQPLPGPKSCLNDLSCLGSMANFQHDVTITVKRLSGGPRIEGLGWAHSG